MKLQKRKHGEMRGQIEKGEERKNKLTLSISPSTKPHRFTQQMSTSRYLCSAPVLLTLMFTSWWILSLSFCAMRSVRDRAHGEMTALATTASTTEAKVSGKRNKKRNKIVSVHGKSKRARGSYLTS